MNKIVFVALLGIFGGLLSCKTETPLSNLTPLPPSNLPLPVSTPLPGGTSSSAVASINAEVYLKIERQLQTPDSATKTLVGICQVPMGSAPGTLVACGPTLGGDFSIPEGDLYFSKLLLTAGTADPGTCATLVIRPYYYIGSTASAVAPAPGFIPPWFTSLASTGVECRKGKAVADCFNGPAAKLVPNFPANKGFYFLTNATLESISVIDSAFSQKQNSNRFTMNDATAGVWGAAFTDPLDGVVSYIGDANANSGGYANASASTPYGYTAGHQDYAVECRNHHFDLIFAVKVVMSDEDTVVGPNSTYDDFHTWR